MNGFDGFEETKFFLKFIFWLQKKLLSSMYEKKSNNKTSQISNQFPGRNFFLNFSIG